MKQKKMWIFYWLILAISILNACSQAVNSSKAQDNKAIVDFDSNNGGIPNHATDISLTPSIVLSFSVPMQASTINSDTVFLSTSPSGANPIEIGNIISNSANTIFHFSSQSPLQSNTQYYVIITSGAKTASGVSVSMQEQFSFTTGDFTAPIVTSITPSNNAAGISKRPSIQIKFSEVVKNVNSTNVTLHAGSATGTIVTIGSITLGADNTYTFSPSADLSDQTTYYVVLSNKITDNTGNALAETQFNFTTGDFTIPAVTSITPSNNAAGISKLPSIQIKFSEAVKNVNSTNVTLHAGSATGTAVAIDNITQGADNTYTFSPSVDLSDQTTYYVVLNSGITDDAGNALAETQFSFTTGDFTAPIVTSITPSNNAAGISKRPSIQIKFSEVVKNVNSTNVTLHAGSATGTIVTIGSITLGADNTYTFSPSADLSDQTTYYVVLSNKITDNTGNALAETQFNFTTGDFTIPTVTSITPSNNAAGISKLPSIQIKFSEAVKNVNSTNVTLHAGSATGTAVAIDNITQGADNTYTFSPSVDLSDQTTYYVVLNSGITDDAGNALAETQFSFTTGGGTFAYIANYGSSTVTKCSVNMNSGALYNCSNSKGSRFSIPFGLIAIESFLYVTNNSDAGLYSNTVTRCAIDNSTGNLSACVDSGASNISAPSGIKFNNGFVYITNNRGSVANTVTKCSVESGTGDLFNCINIQGSNFSYPLGIGFNGNYVYVVQYFSKLTKCRVESSGDLSSCALAINITGNPYGIAFNGSFAYITNNSASKVIKCMVNNAGALNSCSDSGGNAFYSPAGIIFNGDFAYITNADMSGGLYANTITKCTVDKIPGDLNNCSIINGENNFSTPNDIVIVIPK